MKIALVAHNLRVAGGLSVGKNIIKTMPEIAPMHDYLMVIPEGCQYPTFDGNSKVSIMQCPVMPLWKRWYWEKTTLRKSLKQFQPDWIWGLGNLGFGNLGCRQSILLHNPHRVYPIIESNRFFSLKRHRDKTVKILSNKRLRKDLLTIDSVYCQTEVMKQRFSKFYSFPFDRIALCPNAVSHLIQKNFSYDKPLKVLDHYHTRFKLFVLTKYYEHKNLERIVEMYDKYRDVLSETLCLLTISPDQGKKAKALLNQIQSKNLESHILNIGPIPQQELPYYFGESDALFFPTLLESFSGTYLESMTFQCPIITSDLDFAHEICGDAALYVNPFSLESIKNGILELKNSKEKQQTLIEKGVQRKESFIKSWEEILKEILNQEGVEHL